MLIGCVPFTCMLIECVPLTLYAYLACRVYMHVYVFALEAFLVVKCIHNCPFPQVMEFRQLHTSEKYLTPGIE